MGQAQKDAQARAEELQKRLDSMTSIQEAAMVEQEDEPTEFEGNLDHFMTKYSEEKFKTHFRINKTTYMFLFNNLKSALEANGESSGKPRIRGDVQLAATLWYAI